MSINRHRTLEDQIRKLKRDMSAVLRQLKQMEERFEKRFNEMDKRFDGLEKKVDDGFNKTGRSFLAVAKPIGNHCDGEGVVAEK